MLGVCAKKWRPWGEETVTAVSENVPSVESYKLEASGWVAEGI